MKLKITGVADKGSLENERIAIAVLKECDLKFHLLFKTHFGEKGFYGKSLDAIWLTSKKVIAGDRLIIYTKTGNEKNKVNEDGFTTYFIYWGRKEPIFTDINQGVVLVEAADWQLSKSL